ncbi:MAG: hypothetical protein AB1608_05370 [Thermoproteota archaeon]
MSLAIFIIKPIIPKIRGHSAKMWLNNFSNKENDDRKEKRNHNIVLASFTVVVLSLMFNLDPTLPKPTLDTFLFFSVATFVFFITTYLFDVVWNRWIFHMAMSAEYAGLVLVGAGFYYYAIQVYLFPIVTLAYLLFISAILIITLIDAHKMYVNMPKKRIK